MKALIICDECKISSQVNDFLAKQGIDSIIYNWFLKALDNIEEINPDIIIVNGEEFPRHWKIVAQFITSNLFKKKIPLYIYSAKELSSEDSEKISKLENVTLLTSVEAEELSKIVSDDEPFDEDFAVVDKPVCQINTIEEMVEEESEDNYDECDEIPTVSAIIEENEFSDSEILDESMDDVDDEETFGDVDSIVEVTEAIDVEEEFFGDVDNIVETAEVVETEEDTFGDVDNIVEAAEVVDIEEEAFGDVDNIVETTEVVDIEEEAFGDVDNIVEAAEVVEADEEAFSDVDNIIEVSEVVESDEETFGDVDNIVEAVEITEEETEALVQKQEIILRTLINSPVSKRIVAGNLIFNSFEDMKITFVPDYDSDLNQFTKDLEIKNAFYEYERDCIGYKAKILDITQDSNKIEMEFIE